jgi:peptidoglycan hydrolase-like protein with peptidoglycan-binding domain
MRWRADLRSLVVAVPALVVLVASCSHNGPSAAAESIPPIQVSGLPPPTGGPADPTTADPTTDETATTAPQAPTTPQAETTTEPPATTEAPTTTEQPTTTVTIPSNVEVVGPAAAEMPAVGTGSGADTAVVQARLIELGFWAGNTEGKYDFTTKQAVMAFQKYIGLQADGVFGNDTAAYLTNFVEKAHASANTGTLVEIDKAKQLLFLVVDGKTVWAFNTSTGSGIPYEAKNNKDPTKVEKGDAVTPEGLFKTNRERPDGWWEGDLGKIYRPKYFNGGIAVHGMTSVPNHPASHGCVRLSTSAMDFIWDQNLIPLHTAVWVHS